MSKRMAVVGYTQFYTDIRVIREANAAVEAGFELEVFSLKEQERKTFRNISVCMQNKEQYKGKSKLKFILNYVHFFFFSFVQVSKGHFRKKYDVIHVHNMPNFLVFSCILPKLSGTKIILDIHDLVPELFAEKFNLPLNSFKIRLLYFEERISAWFSDIVISTNRLITARLRKNGVSKANIPEILNAADELMFPPFNNHDFHNQKINLIFPSTIAQRLGLDILIDAMKIVNKSNPDIHLKIFGMGEYSDAVKNRIESENLGAFIEFPGLIYFDRLNEELQYAHIGILPWPSGYSTNYQMPIKIHEYFIKGLCVIAADVNIIKEYFKDEVILFEAGNHNDLAHKILDVSKNPERMKRISDSGFNYYKNNSWSLYKSKYISLLKSF